MVDPSSGIRTIIPDCDPNLAITLHPAPLSSTRDDQDRRISEIQGKESAETCELLKPISGADNHGVRTLVLSEVRVAVFNCFHISFFAWNNAYARTCERRDKFIASCISRQVDFIQGGGNLFAQRDFKKDAHSDFRSCILIDLLERFLGRINLNLNRSALNRITYNVVSSTQASEYIKAQNNTGADCDCMLCT